MLHGAKRALLVACMAGGMVSLASAQSLTTTFAGGNGQAGAMFDLTALADLTIDSFDYRLFSGGGVGVQQRIEVYYVTSRSSFQGNETNSGAWTLLGSAVVDTQPAPAPIAVPIGGLSMSAGETIGIYFTNDLSLSALSVAYTNGPLGAFSSPELRFEDRGLGKSYPFGATFSPRIWNGTIYYTAGNPVPGACCLPSGSCTVVLPADCGAQNGAYQGAGTTCGAGGVTCPQPGACCLPGGTCQAMLLAQCTAQGGLFAGENQPCAPCLGEVKGGPYDVETPTGDNRALGVEVAWGHMWVSGTGALPAPGSQRIHKFTLGGTFVASYNQVTNSPAAAYWGGRDGAADETANKMWFGAEAGELSEYDYDPQTGALTHNQLIYPGIANAIRALARNPNTGNFYSGDFGNPIYEFTLSPTPTIVTTFANNANNGTSFAYYGFAWDEVNDTLWGWSQNAPAGGSNQLVRATELNPATMQATGRFFYGIIHPAGAPATHQNIAGGADIVCDHPTNPGRLSFVGLHQSAPDSVVVYDLLTPCAGGCYANCDGSTEPPILNVADFGCFLGKYAAGDPYANCDNSTDPPVLNVADFGCFLGKYAAGCP